jgi:DNA segregation ATPase FtsK/SpoIIIE, S-DNA-T family
VQTPAANTFRKKQTEAKPSEATSQASGSGKASWLAWASDPRTRQVTGIALILLSFFLLVAMVSHIFTGRADQSLLHAEDELTLRQAGQEVENWMGYAGAWASDLLMYRGFGVAAILLTPMLFALGYWVALKRALLNGKRPFSRLLLFGVIWLATVLGLFVLQLNAEERWSWLPGAIGYETGSFLFGMLGWAAWLLVGFAALVFVVFVFNITSFTQARKEVAESISNLQEVNRRETELARALEENDLRSTIDPAFLTPAEDVDSHVPPASGAATDRLGRVVTQEDGVVFELHVGNNGVSAKPTRNGAGEIPELEVVIPPEPIYAPNTNPIVPIGQKPAPEADTEFVVIEPVIEAQTTISKHYDPTLDLSTYRFPILDLLDDHGRGSIMVEREELEANKNTIVNTLTQFSISIASIQATVGPTVTLYEIVPEAGVRISKIKNLEDDIALSLAALGIRIIAPMPGKGTIGIEVPNKNRETVSIRSVLMTEKFQRSEMDLPVVLGKTISNEVFITDLAKMPHLLMAGATGQGKSVGLNVILTSLLFRKHPSQLKFVLVDPKKVELSIFSTIERHFLAKLPNAEEAIITDTRKVVNTLNSLCELMDTRYNLCKDAGCRNIKEYNNKFIRRELNPETGHHYMPYIVLVIDELADLMMTAGKEVEAPIARIAQLARAIGIHMVVATQRPSVNVITGTIKANFPARLSFRVTSKIDSRTILDTGGADRLIGYGDMLLSLGSDLVRLQCPFIDTPEVERVCSFIGEQRGYPTAYMLPEYYSENDPDLDDDSFDPTNRDLMFDDAARIVVAAQQGSGSLLQRKLKLGYARAGRLMDQLEAAGIVGPFEGGRPREVKYRDLGELDSYLKQLDH